MKIKGATYQEIAAKGGGILNSARVVQQLSEDELYKRSLPRAWEIIQSGTAVVEIKSGYGLTLKDELKMLRVARRIGNESDDAERRYALAGTRLADESEDLALLDVKAHAIDGPGHAGFGVKVRLEISNLK